jgi:chromosome segregation ATPase
MGAVGTVDMERNVDRALDVEDLEAPDLPKLARMGTDVLGSVREIRAMLQARADVLETCREVLTDQHARILDQRQRLEREQDSFCDEYEKREADLTDREKRYEGLEDRIRELSATFQSEADDLKRRAEDIRRVEAEHTQRKIVLDTRTTDLATLEREYADRKREFEQSLAGLDADRERIRLSSEELAGARERYDHDREQLEAERREHDDAVARLEGERTSLQESLDQLEDRHREFEQQVAALEQRETRVVEQQGTLELRIQQLARQKDEMIALRQRWEEKINELNTASTNLSALREQLVEEVGHISNERTEILSRFGLTERSWSKGGSADGGLPSTSEPAVPASVERYQKLCRDARRRAIGSI